jgi:hypothetical protein
MTLVGDDTPPWEKPDDAIDPALIDPQAVAPGDAVVPTDVAPPEVTSFVDWLSKKAEENDDDTIQALVDVIREMATATSPAEVLAGGYPLHAREVLGRPMLVTGVKIRQGNWEDNNGLGFYAVMDVVFMDTEQVRVVTCSGKRVLVKLWGLDVMDGFPIPMTISEKKRPGTDKTIQDLHPVEDVPST